jgi:Ca2+/H+ antiporter, TMEM165/GDT1 family
MLATYWTVLVAELAGDKAIYTVTSLTMRFPPRPVACGIAIAFAGKMLAAVLLGGLLFQLPPRLVAAASCLTFFVTAALLHWRREETSMAPPVERWSNAMAVSFAAIFFSEWGDVGQISTAALAAQYRLPIPIFLGATMALLTKGVLAMTLGAGLRNRFGRGRLRSIAVFSCIVLGLLSLGDAVLR